MLEELNLYGEFKMTDSTIQTQYAIKISKNQGLTQALKKHLESLPNSVSSDGIISKSEWDAAIDVLIDINNSRNADEKIFKGVIDKSKDGWHNSFIVYKDQVVTFTQEEMNRLYEAMGVTFTKAENKDKVGSEDDNNAKDNTQLEVMEQQNAVVIDDSGNQKRNLLQKLFCKNDGSVSVLKTGLAILTFGMLAAASVLLLRRNTSVKYFADGITKKKETTTNGFGSKVKSVLYHNDGETPFKIREYLFGKRVKTTEFNESGILSEKRFFRLDESLKKAIKYSDDGKNPEILTKISKHGFITKQEYYV